MAKISVPIFLFLFQSDVAHFLALKHLAEEENV